MWSSAVCCWRSTSQTTFSRNCSAHSVWPNGVWMCAVTAAGGWGAVYCDVGAREGRGGCRGTACRWRRRRRGAPCRTTSAAIGCSTRIAVRSTSAGAREGMCLRRGFSAHGQLVRRRFVGPRRHARPGRGRLGLGVGERLGGRTRQGARRIENFFARDSRWSGARMGGKRGQTGKRFLVSALGGVLSPRALRRGAGPSPSGPGMRSSPSRSPRSRAWTLGSSQRRVALQGAASAAWPTAAG